MTSVMHMYERHARARSPESARWCRARYTALDAPQVPAMEGESCEDAAGASRQLLQTATRSSRGGSSNYRPTRKRSDLRQPHPPLARQRTSNPEG